MKNGHSPWMLYGAYGTTGELILEEALRRGHRPLLAGRNQSRLSDLASKTGLDAIAFGVQSARQATPALDGVSVLVNAAGPYFETGGPLRRLCLETGASYVDVNGEIGDFVAAVSCDAEARARGVAIIPGAGFGVVFGEAVAARVASRLADASWLRLSLAPANALTSRGAALSTASVLVGGGYVVSHGELRARPTAHRTWHVEVERHRVPALRFAAAPRAEVLAAHRLTGIREIVAGVPLSLAAAIVLRAAGRLVGAMLLRRTDKHSRAKPSPKPDSTEPRSRVWAEAGNGAGKRVTALLETGEGYRLAAMAAVRAVEKVLAERPIGVQTPAQAFGAEFALSLPETRITDF
jgi:short subunit dehydrogenase-like uncharacterized protein